MNLLNLLEFDWKTLAIFGVFAVLIIVMSIFSNKQRKKQMAEEQKKKDSICPGTTVITIGGIMGVVTSVNHEESTFTLQTGTAEIKFDKRAIYQMTLPENKKAKEEKAE